MRTAVVSRLVAALLLGAAAAVGAPVAPASAAASAAACASATGVTVVVDFNELGGGVQLKCDGSGGGDTAASLLTGNGYPLTYAQRQPGFVCRVSGVPASDPCIDTSPSNAYWSLYWSDGESGRWVYASTSAASLQIPDGGYVAFSWKQGAAAAPPSAPATAHAAPPPPEPTQAPSPDVEPTASAAPSDPPEPTKSPKPPKPSEPGKKGDGKKGDGKKKSPSASPSVAASDDPDDAAPTSSPPAADGDGLPGWVAPIVIVVLFAAATATVIRRRRGAATR